MAALTSAATVSVKPADDDPYSVAAPVKKVDTVGAAKSSAQTATPDSIAKPAVKADTAIAKKDTARVKSDTSAAKTDSVAAKKDTALAKTDSVTAETPKADSVPVHKTRPRIVRETTVNALNESKGSYRSPKKALFMSLVVPGLGQAYVGQNAFTYARAAAYLGVDVTLAIFWHQYVVVKHDRQVARYRAFADTAWIQSNYEQGPQGISDQANRLESDPGTFDNLNPNRESYCDAVQSASGTTANTLSAGCKDPIGKPSEYSAFVAYVNTSTNGQSGDSIHTFRSNFPGPFQFYELIGKYQEFVTGWKDVQNVNTTNDSTVEGTSAYRDQYVAMRSKASEYARLQAWFIGGMVVNHLVSALDAALTARAHNKSLYQTETAWYDRLHLESGLSFDGFWPRTQVLAAVSF